jgi:hypothetical protein
VLGIDSAAVVADAWGRILGPRREQPHRHKN